jgi:hypothetical protein
MGVKETFAKIGSALSGGAVGAAADEIKKRPKNLDDQIEAATSSSPAKPASAPKGYSAGGMVRRGYGKARGA